MKYTYVGISLNELRDLDLHCDAATPNCGLPSADDLIVKFGFDSYGIGMCAGILVLYIVFCRVVAYLGIRYLK